MTSDADALTSEDERQIAALMLRCATGIDTRNWALFRTCFTDAFRGEYGHFGTWQSGTEITEAMESMHKSVGPTLHRMSNFVASPAPGGAIMRSYVDVILESLEPGGPVHHAAGYYDDELARTKDGWKIKRRKFTSVRLT